MAEFNLGQKVRYTHTLYRQVEGGGWSKLRRVWKPIPTFTKVPREGIVVGLRTLQNGTREYDEDSGYYFVPDRENGYVTAYMVAFDLRRSPVHVLPEHLEKVLDEEQQ